VIIALQEHWLINDNLCQLGTFRDDCSYYGVSGMTLNADLGLLSGRPYGGVGFVWHKSLSPFVHAVGKDSLGHCCAVTIADNNRHILVINVYFLCFSQSAEYFNELSEWLGFIDDTLCNSMFSDAVIIGDTNFSCAEQHGGYKLLHKLLQSFNLSSCDNMLNPSNTMTYVNSALGQMSSIDHAFVTNDLKNDVMQYKILDMANNFSRLTTILSVLF